MKQSEIILPKLGVEGVRPGRVKLRLAQDTRPPKQQKRNGHAIIKRQTKEERIKHFWESVDKKSESDCWNWLLYKNQEGYGRFNWLGKLISTHRIAYYLSTGIDPISMLVLHSCDNPSCCNPGHLFLGTDRDNCHDKINKGRDVKADGGNHWKASISDKDAIAIRAQHREFCDNMAARFGITRDALRSLLLGKTWKKYASL